MKPKNPHAGRWYCTSCNCWHDDGPLSKGSAGERTVIRIVKGRAVRVPVEHTQPKPELASTASH